MLFFGALLWARASVPSPQPPLPSVEGLGGLWREGWPLTQGAGADSSSSKALPLPPTQHPALVFLLGS